MRRSQGRRGGLLVQRMRLARRRARLQRRLRQRRRSSKGSRGLSARSGIEPPPVRRRRGGRRHLGRELP
jgi:hypothetical protein